jgi:hypothetical protein
MTAPGDGRTSHERAPRNRSLHRTARRKTLEATAAALEEHGFSVRILPARILLREESYRPLLFIGSAIPVSCNVIEVLVITDEPAGMRARTASRAALRSSTTASQALRILAAADVLGPDDQGRIRMAYPFSAAPTRHVVAITGGPASGRCAPSTRWASRSCSAPAP